MNMSKFEPREMCLEFVGYMLAYCQSRRGELKLMLDACRVKAEKEPQTVTRESQEWIRDIRTTIYRFTLSILFLRKMEMKLRVKYESPKARVNTAFVQAG